MAKDVFREVLQHRIDAGDWSVGRWWDESRIPLGSIDRRLSDLIDLRGKKALVTGGAGINLGQACVNRLAGSGADVAVVDLSAAAVKAAGRTYHREPPDAAAVADAAARKWGAKVIAVEGDVLEWDSLTQVYREVAERLGGIDIVVNNAIDAAVGDFETLSVEDIDRTIRGTLRGTLYSSRIALDYLIPQRSGRIINVGSDAGGTHVPWLTLYGSLKAGVAQFTRFLGREVGHHGIQVMGVAPGSMWGPGRPLPPEVPESLAPLARTALERFQLPEEIANMVAFLASDASSAMNGVMIEMGGGLSV
ncbi:SDR family NAD(P)-dependent oxidoreductase [Amycolatopsis jejuensis]|uniref:SDR family NAD(P)-dependent oxidoreductase n=1 Tax=Amycolatopsis jejuensis TaxID=330084 RepID=UPI0005263FF6|nr:SDR family oxidoreductase [Amycolatopsis jejuensis]